MSEFNWGVIEDGGAFESLTASLVNATDPGAKLYGRSGKDSGLDAKSSDGSIAYQAKYRQGMTMDVAIKSALEELAKIEVYRGAGHANYQHWLNVNTWVLVGNFRINPNDDKKWNEKVVPKFAPHGITAKYWSLETLEKSLLDHPEISDVFFGGQNRVLVSLTEAFNLISQEMIAAISLENPLVNQTEAIAQIRAFAETDKRIIPIVGPGGIGKTRIAFEVLSQLESEGWRCFWALPSSMGASAQWFRLLNGTQKTVVALDNPDSFALVRAVVEQLTASERANWKVVLLLRSENSEIFERFSGNEMFGDAIQLSALNESDSHALINSIVGGEQNTEWLHRVFNFTHGNAGWLCLVAELFRQGNLGDFPIDADGIAQTYFNSCVNSIPGVLRPKAIELVRWLSLWGTIRLKPDGEASKELIFLNQREGISFSETKQILEGLAKAGLISNWGFRKSAFAVEPLTIRHQILASWLLEQQTEGFVVGAAGKDVLQNLIEGKIPSLESALRTLTQIVDARLGENEAVSFLSPLFDRLEEAANDNLREQFAALSLLEKVGPSDPERAIEVLGVLRENPTESITIEDDFWGSRNMSHANLLSKIPWSLYELAKYIDDAALARKLLVELGVYVQLESEEKISSEHGKKAGELLKRVLCGTRNSKLFAQPGVKLAIKSMPDEGKWPFAGLLIDGLLNPDREFSGWTAANTISFSRYALQPGMKEWSAALKIKQSAFRLLEARKQRTFTNQLWRILGKGHHDFHRVLFHHKIETQDKPVFIAELKSDLERVHAYLQANNADLSLSEATHIREFWSWYLKHGKEHELVAIAQSCEEIYASINKWCLQDFFRFDYDANLIPETERVVREFKDAENEQPIQDFFDEAASYLNSVRDGKNDGADNWRIGDLASACTGLFEPASKPPNPLTRFVIATVENAESSNRLAWTFSTSLWRGHLRAEKTKGVDVTAALVELLSLTKTPSALWVDLYGFPHPKSIGPIEQSELEFFDRERNCLAQNERFQLFGSFYEVGKERIKKLVTDELDSIKNLADQNSCFLVFFRYLRFYYLRFSLTPSKATVDWLIQLLIDYKLDGAILGDSDFEWMRNESDYVMNGRRFLALMQSRIDMEQQKTADDSFSTVPHEFPVDKLCKFDFSEPAEVAAFRGLCTLGLGHSFVSYYFVPKYLAKLDLTGERIRDWVVDQLAAQDGTDFEKLKRLSYFASAFDDVSNKWELIASPICDAAAALKRSERTRVYFGLSEKETGVMTSMPGEVPFHYTNRLEVTRKKARSISTESATRSYWTWAYERAKDDFEREQARVEEDRHA